MKLGIIGLPQSGKNTIFEALTHNFINDNNLFEDRTGIIKVRDDRLDILTNMYNPKKTVNAKVEYFLPKREINNKQNIHNYNNLSKIRDCDALVHVIRNFDGDGLNNESLLNECNSLKQELILSDIIVVEKRLEKLTIDKRKGKKFSSDEFFLLQKCLKVLEKGKSLIDEYKKTPRRILKGYSFLSAKPILTLINNSDENNKISQELIENQCIVVRGKLEQELAQMDIEDSKYFLSEFKISKSVIDQVINASYSILGLISFFTVGKDEVRAWTLKKNTPALDAAETIHSDIKKGFIRAEIVSYKDLLEAKTYVQARKNGTVRLEGKTYIVCDGDIINFRFNV